MGRPQDSRFVNEITMNEYTLREILLALWKDKASRHAAPVVVYLVIVVGIMVYAFVTGKSEFMLLAGAIGLAGLIALLVYAAIFGISSARKRERVIRQTIDKYGSETVLTTWIGNDIRYRFGNVEKTIAYADVERLIEVEMYLIIQLKTGIELPIWKAGFTRGTWEEFVPYIKQLLGNR